MVSKFDNINLLVRQAKVSLFIGSGFSLKAGGPSAGMLVRSLATRFPKGYKKGLRSLPLDDISKEYIRMRHGNRNDLVAFLKEKMSFKRKDLSDHQALALIPHFKHIFTTNYDTLLEDSFPANRVRVVRCNVDCALPEKEVNIYKIHGDLTCKEQLVITREDYDALLATDKNSLVWNKVTDAFASTDVVFLGYSLDDTNVQILLDRVSAILGEERRRVFLIAPKLAEEKVFELSTRDVTYVDANAEEFLKSLANDLKDNVYFDLISGNVPQDIAIRFLENYRIKTVIEYDKGKLVVKSIDPADETVPQTIHFTTKAQTDFLKDSASFDFASLAKRSERLKCPAILFNKDSIIDFERRINGVKVMRTEDVGTVEIGPSTIKEGQMDVIVPESGFIEKVDYRTYRSGSNFVLSMDTPLCILELIWEVVDGTMKDCVIRTIYKDDYGQYEKAVAWTYFFIALFSGKQVFFGENIGGRIDPKQYQGFVSQFRKSLVYYDNVRKIEILRKKLFEKHEKYEEGKEDLSSLVLHLLAEDSFVEKLNMSKRIEFIANPGVTIPTHTEEDTPKDYFAIRISQTTDEEVVLNGISFGRITLLKDLTKSHIAKVYTKNGKQMASIAPDVDHWVVRYVKAGE